MELLGKGDRALGVLRLAGYGETLPGKGSAQPGAEEICIVYDENTGAHCGSISPRVPPRRRYSTAYCSVSALRNR